MSKRLMSVKVGLHSDICCMTHMPSRENRKHMLYDTKLLHATFLTILKNYREKRWLNDTSSAIKHVSLCKSTFTFNLISTCSQF